MRGWKLALLAGTCITYFAVFGKWKLAMTTLSLVLVTAPIAFAIGLGIGIVAVKRPGLEKVIWPVLNLFQALPHFGFLIPIVVFVGLGHKAGAVATILFAFPPMAKLALVGLRGVPNEVLEAGTMAGCTRRQMLWKVRLPLAFPEMMLGLNQTIMFGLFMVMIAGFIGGNYDLAREIFKAKANNEAGLGVLLALCVAFLGLALDRLIHCWADRRKAALGISLGVCTHLFARPCT